MIKHFEISINEYGITIDIKYDNEKRYQLDFGADEKDKANKVLEVLEVGFRL